MDTNEDIITYFQKIKVGDLELKNRMVMASLTRMRCDDLLHGTANQIMAKYYSERADFGLILTECSQICQRSNAFPGSAGIYTQDQVDGWKQVVQAVHNKGGLIAIQIWHAGRVANLEQNGGLEPWAPSPIKIPGKSRFFHNEFFVPHEMTIQEIKETILQFRKGAENAKLAGFDGIQLHGAHGYLIDSFIRDRTNQRTDEYGGSVEKRCKFPLEVIDQLVAVFGAGRVGIKLSPVNRENDMYDSNPQETYSYLIKELDKRNIAFIELREAEPVPADNQFGDGAKQIPNVCKLFRPLFKGTIIANERFNKETGLLKIQNGEADLISFGKLTINNPDLVKRFKNNWPLNTNYDIKTWMCPGIKGYLDFQTYENEAKDK